MIKKLMAAGIVAGAVLVPSAAFAAPPGLAPNSADQQSSRSENCIAYYSAYWQHNGQATTLGQGGDPSHGARGDEIKGLQATCGAQS